MNRVIRHFLILVLALNIATGQTKHSFSFSANDFLLDGKPIQIISGELHPARIPKEYWRHRIQMVKAMGCNTIAAYLFWNYHESAPGKFDFETGNKDIAQFIRIAKEEEMWVLLRPGPYVCAEWDFGGLPPYLLKYSDIKVRCSDARYLSAVKRYINKVAKIVKPFLASNGGPILMVQIENEYGSYGNDKNYLEQLKSMWVQNGIPGPFYTADGATPYMLEAGNLKGAAIGLDSGSNPADFETAHTFNPEVPSFSSETYPGWLTHWGEKYARPDTSDLLHEIKFLLDNKKSFNLYVAHGGTNFGFTAGANSGGKGYEPDITSYDYDAPINEQGRPTEKYYAIRRLISHYVKSITDPPQPISTIEIPAIKMRLFTSVWNNLTKAEKVIQPIPMERTGQYQGFIVYKTKLIGHKSGTLKITDLHDYALVFLNGKYIGKLDRRLGENSIQIPKSDIKYPELEIFVEAMGRINFAQELIDRKGITDRVTLNGMTLMNWELINLPFDSNYINTLKESPVPNDRRGCFFKGNFNLEKTGDTFIDLANYKKGIVFINGNNLGRYWDIGPQKRLYCPATFLKKKGNEIVVFDLHETEAHNIETKSTLE